MNEWKAAGRCGYLQRTGQAIPLGRSRVHIIRPVPGRTLLRQAQDACARSAASVAAAGVDLRLAQRRRYHRKPLGPVLRFYIDTGGRKWGTPYLTRDFFSRLGAGLAHQTLLGDGEEGRQVYRRRPQPVRGRRAVRRNWGREYVPFPAFLRPAITSQSILPLCAGLKRVEAERRENIIAARLPAGPDLQRPCHPP